MNKTYNPRFCGVELPRVGQTNIYEAVVHGANVRVLLTKRGWLSSAYFSLYGIEIREDMHAASWKASLLSLRGRIRNLHRSLAPFEPKKRWKATS